MENIIVSTCFKKKMASFGYDDLFNTAHFVETFSHSRTGLKSKFAPKKNGFIPRSGFSEQMTTTINNVNRGTPTPRQPFRAKKERYLTKFDQFSYIENNDSTMSNFAVCHCPLRTSRRKPTACRTRYRNWTGLNSS
jgi:hypothetical protein